MPDVINSKHVRRRALGLVIPIDMLSHVEPLPFTVTKLWDTTPTCFYGKKVLVLLFLG